jgi:hypothetical protein
VDHQATRVKVTFAEDRSAAELEVSTPVNCNVGLQIWAVLSSLRIRILSAYVVRNGRCLVAHVKLAEYGGAPLTEQRATQLINLLKQRVSRATESDAVARPRLVGGEPQQRAHWSATGPHETNNRRTA